MPAYQYTQATLRSFDSAFSQARLDTYLQHARLTNAHATTADALDLYIWNLQVSAAFCFNALRDLRNRVMHHEPLFHRTLPQDFADILEAISWMYDDVAPWVDHHSRWSLVRTTQGNRPETF